MQDQRHQRSGQNEARAASLAKPCSLLLTRRLMTAAGGLIQRAAARMTLRFSANVSTPSYGSTIRAHAGFSAGHFRGPAGAIDTSDRSAVRCRVSCDIEIYCIAFLRRKLRVWQEGKPRDRVEGRFGFVPLDARVFDPEGGVPVLAPICHLVHVEKLNGDIEPAHLVIFLQVPDQLVLQPLRVALL